VVQALKVLDLLFHLGQVHFLLLHLLPILLNLERLEN
jgi:hypothetical protein